MEHTPNSYADYRDKRHQEALEKGELFKSKENFFKLGDVTKKYLEKLVFWGMISLPFTAGTQESMTMPKVEDDDKNKIEMTDENVREPILEKDIQKVIAQSDLPETLKDFTLENLDQFSTEQKEWIADNLK